MFIFRWTYVERTQTCWFLVSEGFTSKGSLSRQSPDLQEFSDLISDDAHG